MRIWKESKKIITAKESLERNKNVILIYNIPVFVPADRVCPVPFGTEGAEGLCPASGKHLLLRMGRTAVCGGDAAHHHHQLRRGYSDFEV